MRSSSLSALLFTSVAASLLLQGSPASPQTGEQNPLLTKGRISIDGQSTPYLIRRLPVSSFPDLPTAIQAVLNQRGCLIPQTWQAHGPENVVHASLERAGSSDWAVLCSAQGTVSLLVFFSSSTGVEPIVLTSAPEIERLQAHGTNGEFGFNWGIDPATPEQTHEAQAGLTPRPQSIDHDALADTTIDRSTVYHFYVKGAWTFLEMPAP